MLRLRADTARLGPIRGLNRALPDIRGRHLFQPQRRRIDKSRQAHAAERGPKQFGALIARAAHQRAIGQHHVQRFDKRGDGPLGVVVFAVDICGNAAAERGELGPRRNGGKKPCGRAKRMISAKVMPACAYKNPALQVEVEQVLEGQGGDDALVQAGVAVGAAIALGQDWSLGGATEIA